MAARAERRDVLGVEILHLVDEYNHAYAHVGGQAGHIGE